MPHALEGRCDRAFDEDFNKKLERPGAHSLTRETIADLNSESYIELWAVSGSGPCDRFVVPKVHQRTKRHALTFANR